MRFTNQAGMEGRSKVATGSQTFCTESFSDRWKFFFVKPSQLFLQVEDPAVVEVEVEETPGSGCEVAFAGKIDHKAERLLAGKAEMEMVLINAHPKKIFKKGEPWRMNPTRGNSSNPQSVCHVEHRLD